MLILTTCSIIIIRNNYIKYHTLIDRYEDNDKFIVLRYTNFCPRRISGISWRSFSLVDETGEYNTHDRPAAIHWQTLSPNIVSSTRRHEWDLKSWKVSMTFPQQHHHFYCVHNSAKTIIKLSVVNIKHD
jgi:hypothetical protein